MDYNNNGFGSTETALQASEDRFRLLVDSVRDYAIFMLDADGCVRSWNPGGERAPVPVPHDQFVAAFKTWKEAGGPCPAPAGLQRQGIDSQN